MNALKNVLDRLNMLITPHEQETTCPINRQLVWVTILLIGIGMLSIASASTALGDRYAGNPWLFTRKHIWHLLLALGVFISLVDIPLYKWYRGSALGLAIALILLAFTPILGHSVNGSSRWIQLLGMRFQPSEYAKWAYLCYLARYLSLKQKEITNSSWGFVKPFGVLILLSIFLLKQPDFGSVFLILMLTLLLLFLANAQLWQFSLVFCTGGLLVTGLICSKPYRLIRLATFLDPWKDPFGAGYQLTQSLMAFARGSLIGTGLGYGMQKLDYLPEPHTDFIFSIIAEEMGCLGSFCVLALLSWLFFCGGSIAARALQLNQRFGGFLAYGITCYFALQTLLNLLGAIGLLPMKGLTIPFLSYGGSSLLIAAVMMAGLFRVDFETRQLMHSI